MRRRWARRRRRAMRGGGEKAAVARPSVERRWQRRAVSGPACSRAHTHTYHQLVRVRREWLGSSGRRAHLGSRRHTTHTNSSRPSLRGTWARPAMSEDAAGRSDGAARARSFCHAPSSAAPSLQHASKASTHVPIVQHMHAGLDALRKQLHSTCSKLEENGCCTTRAMRWFAANAPMRRAAAPRGRPTWRAQLFHVDV